MITFKHLDNPTEILTFRRRHTFNLWLKSNATGNPGDGMDTLWEGIKSHNNAGITPVLFFCPYSSEIHYEAVPMLHVTVEDAEQAAQQIAYEV